MRFLKKLLPFAIIVAAAAVLLYLPDIGPESHTDLESFFKTELGRQGYRGYTVAVVEDGRLSYVGAFGRDAEGKDLATDSPLLLGGVSRTFTGLATLSLAREGILSIDEPVIDSLSWFGAGAGGPAAAGVQMKVRHLLSRTTGISASSFDDYHPDAADLEDAVSRFALARPERAPGLGVSYLDSDYQALALVLETRSGVSFDDIVAVRILRPLGMTRSFTRADIVAEVLPAGSTSFFGATVPRSGVLPAFAASSGYIVSTAEDMGRYLVYLTAPERLARTPVPARDLPALFAPLVESSPYTYGWRVRGEGKEVEALATGSLPGYSASVALWPGKKAAVAILAPQNSFLLSAIAMPGLVAGARDIVMSGEASRPFPLLRLYILLAIASAVHLLVLIIQTGSALGWTHDVRCRAEASGSRGPLRFAVARSALGIVVRFALVAFAPSILGMALGRAMDWNMAFTLEPGLAAWFMAATVLGSLRNIARLAWLGRRD